MQLSHSTKYNEKMQYQNCTESEKQHPLTTITSLDHRLSALYSVQQQPDCESATAYKFRIRRCNVQNQSSTSPYRIKLAHTPPRPSSRCRIRQRRGCQAVVMLERRPGRRRVRAALSQTSRRRVRRVAVESAEPPSSGFIGESQEPPPRPGATSCRRADLPPRRRWAACCARGDNNSQNFCRSWVICGGLSGKVC